MPAGEGSRAGKGERRGAGGGDLGTRRTDATVREDAHPPRPRVKKRALVLVAVPSELPVELLGGELGEVRHVPFGRLLLHGRTVD